MSEDGIKILGENRKARHDFFVEDTLECGIVLLGTEVKSIKSSQFSFPDSYVEVQDDQLIIRGLHINPYKMSSQFNHDPDRPKILLAHKLEIAKLKRKSEEKGFTLIPLKFYLKKGLIKLELGLCKGKKMFDKRDTIKAKDQQRDQDRELKRF